MTFQEEISLARQSLFLEKEMEVLIDTIFEEGSIEGRSFREAPEVDGIIEIRGVKEHHMPGDIVNALITDVFEHDMLAKEVSS